MPNSLQPHGLVVSNSLQPHGLILQARILEWVAFPFSRGSSQPREQTQVSRTAGRFFTSGKPKNTGLSSLSLLQWMFLTQEWNLGLLHCRLILYQLSYQGSPIRIWDIPIQCPNPWGSASSSLWLLFSLSGVWYLVNTHGCKQGISCSSDSLEHSTHNKAIEEYLNF